MDAHRDDAARRREAEGILTRVRQETEPQVGAGLTSMMTNMRGHFAAADADPNDRIEVIGTRIGRALGIVMFAVLLFVLVSRYLLP